MPLICQFIASRRQEYGVAPIWRALGVLDVQIAPRTYRAHLARPPSKRALWDAVITEVLGGHYEPDAQGHRPPECLDGATKRGAYLHREGIEVARCTVERLMRANRWRGATRTQKVRTTVADPAATRAPDLVNRQFHAAAPALLHVTDFPSVPLAGGGFGYTAFVIDAYAGLIPGWACSTSKHTSFVEAATRHAIAYRRHPGHPLGAGAIHHSDAGSQYTAVHFGQTLFLEGLTPSIGSVGDAYNNALAETTIGLYKTECIRAGSPFRRSPIHTLADLEEITSARVH
jgi:putative transposase